MSDLEQLAHVLLSVFPVYRDYVKSDKLAHEFVKIHSNAIGDLRYVMTGSFRERFPDVVYSDIDVMVVLNPSDEILTLETQSKVFQPVGEAPAHVKLIIPKSYNESFREKYHTISTFLALLETEEDSGSCFVSAEGARRLHERDFLPEFMADKKPSAPWTTSERAAESTTSPAYTFRTPIKDKVTQTHRANVEVDRVPAIECMGWPTGAYEWKIRQPRNWPSADVVKTISTSGFMIVPKPSDISGDTRREWRISFSNPEAELLDSFNECQAKVYYMLRSLHVRYLKEKLQGVLTSYHLKTVMFWVLEEEEHNVWSEESSLEMFFRVLRKLLEFTKDGFCPHYFIRDHNLFCKTLKRELEVAVSELSRVLHDPFGAFGNLVNQSFLGLMPRLGLLDVEVKGKLNKKILSLSRSSAYAAFTNPEGHELVRNLELECLSKTLEETAASIKAFPGGTVLIEVYIDAIVQGHQFAFTMGKNEAELTKITMSSIQEDFFEMETANVNQGLLVWMELGKIAVDYTTQGINDKVFCFLLKFYKFMRHQSGPLTDEEKETMETFQAICSTAGAFLATVNFSANNISYQQLHELLCDILLPFANGNIAESPSIITLVVFVLGGATCKMAKSFFD